MAELLKQGQYTPFHVVDQIISIFAGPRGYMDDIPVPSVRAFEKGLLDYMNTVGKPIRDELMAKPDVKAVEKKVRGGGGGVQERVQGVNLRGVILNQTLAPRQGA